MSLPPSILGKQLRHFPYTELRPKQSEVLRHLEKQSYFMLQAPTGFGKSVLTFTGIWYRMIWGERQLWLFAKTKTQLQRVFLHNLKEHYAHPPADQLTIVPLIARRDLCTQSQCLSCRGCPAKVKAHYLPVSRVKELLQYFSLDSCPKTFLGFQQYLTKFGCPYDLIRRMIPHANIVLLTQGYLESMFLRDVLDRLLLKAEHYNFRYRQREVIIDEAHNFGSTVEAVLTREQLTRALEIGSFPVVKALSNLLDQPLGRVDRPRGAMPADLKPLDVFLRQKRSRRFLTPEDYEVLQAVRTFIERKGQYWVLNEQGLVQLNPWPDLIFNFLRMRFKRIILLSGTFHNIRAYGMYYGFGDKFPFYQYCVPSPPERRRQLFFGAYYHPAVSSKPENRTPELYAWTADLIHELALVADDHTLVFVPSYEVLNTIYPLLQDRLQGQLSLYREPTKGRISYLNELKVESESVVLAVYGGKFSEGIEIRHPDTKRSRVRLVILVGLPFPPPTPEYHLLNRLYSKRWFPRFAQWALVERILYTQVQQCLGRTIRSDQDQGAAIILDYRAVRRLRLPGMHVFRTESELLNRLMLALIRAKK
jgi:DNA excision repair protein ERCC-2